MCVDEAWNEYLVRALDKNARLVSTARVRGRQYIDNSTVSYRDSVISQYQSVWLNRDTPASQNQGVTMRHYVCFERDRKGAFEPVFGLLV